MIKGKIEDIETGLPAEEEAYVLADAELDAIDIDADLLDEEPI